MQNSDNAWVTKEEEQEAQRKMEYFDWDVDSIDNEEQQKRKITSAKW